MVASTPKDIYDLTAHWVVLATGTFVTACATGNFAPLDLLKAPAIAQGKIDGRAASIAVPKWFPLDEAIFEAGGGAIYTKVRDLPLPRNVQPAGDNAIRAIYDVGSVALAPEVRTFTLSYFPWFRFLSEPVGFDAAGRVAEYIAGCFRFLLAREGAMASVETLGDLCRVTALSNLHIETEGMQSLRRIAIREESAQTIFDLEARRFVIDRRMFPAAYAAGRQILDTPDRLINIEMVISDEHLTLTSPSGVIRV